MAYAPSSSRARQVPVALKILVAGGFGVGKTTLVASCSEILPLQTEELLTDASIGTDDLAYVEDKGTTTVVMDFGRISITDDLVLYLFGTPGQDRFWFLWDELALGALGRSSWPTPAGWPTASPPSTTSSAGAPRSWSR